MRRGDRVGVGQLGLTGTALDESSWRVDGENASTDHGPGHAGSLTARTSDWRAEVDHINRHMHTTRDIAGEPYGPEAAEFYAFKLAGMVGQLITTLGVGWARPSRHCDYAFPDELADCRIYLRHLSQCFEIDEGGGVVAFFKPGSLGFKDTLRAARDLYRNTAILLAKVNYPGDADIVGALASVRGCLREVAASLNIDEDVEASCKVPELYARWPEALASRELS